MAEIRIEPFSKAKHDRSRFSCGQPSLDAFLRTLVTQYEKRRLGRTFVAARPDGRVLGYFTPAQSMYEGVDSPVSPDELKRRESEEGRELSTILGELEEQAKRP